MRFAPRILIVEDEPAFRRALAMALEDEGYVVDAAPHGAIALELVERNRPDAILLDLNMPVMDGKAFLQAYHVRSQDVPPVVICSTRSVNAAQMGVEIAASVTKPVDIEEILSLIERLTGALIPVAITPVKGRTSTERTRSAAAM
jgi:DNA-binding response OmpR family regulator